ncbi:hypothetical protein HDU96_004602 [Phlyctochytrium bullatum]|nr:hypothetical protein HDU96_004602 [Phlyctochytrium bullatum]
MTVTRAPSASAGVQQRKRPVITTLLPTSVIVALLWFSLPTAARIIIRRSIAKRLVQLATFIGGPDFSTAPKIDPKVAVKPPSSLNRGNRSLPPVSASPASKPQAAAASDARQAPSQAPTRTPPPKAPAASSQAPPSVDEEFDEEDCYDPDLTTASTASSRTAAAPTPESAPALAPNAASDVGPYIAAKHKPHRHTAAGDRALRLLLDLEPLEENGWEPMGEKGGVRIHTRPVDGGGGIPIVRGDGWIEGEFTVQEAFSVIRSSNCRKIWDPRYDTGESIEHFNTDEALSYSIQKGTFPVAPRDLVTALFCKREPVDRGGRLYYYLTSVVDPTAPSEGKARVRAEVAVSGWILRPTEGKGLETSYIVQVDPKGTIPSALVKLVQTQTPLCIAEVSRYLNRAGPIPFLVRDVPTLGPGPDVVLMQEEHDAQAQKYDLELTIRTSPPSPDGRRGLFAIALPRAGYAFGADVGVSVVPAGGAEVRARLVMGEAVSGRVVVPEVLRGVVGSATGWVVELWVEGEGEEVELEVRVEPGRHGVVVNGEPVELRN